MTHFTVRRLRDVEWRAYRTIRLRALADSPHAFGSTLAVEQAKPDEYWIQRVAEVSSPAQLPLVAESAGQLVGLVWGWIDPAQSHTAHVFQMWVAPEARGVGCGAALLDGVVGWARQAGASTVQLRVTCGDTAARRLYERAGFRTEGEPEALRPGAGALAQPMTLFI